MDADYFLELVNSKTFFSKVTQKAVGQVKGAILLLKTFEAVSIKDKLSRFDFRV